MKTYKVRKRRQKRGKAKRTGQRKLRKLTKTKNEKKIQDKTVRKNKGRTRREKKRRRRIMEKKILNFQPATSRLIRPVRKEEVTKAENIREKIGGKTGARLRKETGEK